MTNTAKTKFNKWLDQPLGKFGMMIWSLMDYMFHPYTLVAFMSGLVMSVTGSISIGLIAWMGVGAIVKAILSSKE